MQKKIIAAGLTLASTMAVAGPYVGAGYQAGEAKLEQRDWRSPVVDGQALDLSDSNSSSDFTALLGYRFNDTWALELSWQRAELDDDFEIRGATQDEEWDASVDGSHFVLSPVYRHALGEKLALRASAGVVYGRYDVSQSHVIDVENGPDQTLSSVSRSESEFGGAVGVGLEYTTPWKLDVIGELKYQRTKVLSNTGVAVNLVYRF
jgi:opacity protein-like surface antigen